MFLPIAPLQRKTRFAESPVAGSLHEPRGIFCVHTLTHHQEYASLDPLIVDAPLLKLRVDVLSSFWSLHHLELDSTRWKGVLM